MLTGDALSFGADYYVIVDSDTYDIQHWDGTQWTDTPYATVTVSSGSAGVLVSVNKSEIGNTSDVNFSVDSFNVATHEADHAPADGMFNYSLDFGGPAIQSIAVQTTPSTGPKAGRQFAVAPVGLTLPPSGAIATSQPKPDAYNCTATLAGRALVGAGTGGCTFRPTKAARGKTLSVVLTVSYQGATKTSLYKFTVH